VNWTGAAATLAFGAGIAGAVQVGLMGRFGERIGSLEATAFVILLTAVISTVVLLVARRSLHGLVEGLSVPKWLWLAAAMGVVVVTVITVAAPRIGTTATVGLMIAGQLAGAVAIERFGWLGVDRVTLTWARVAGVALLVLGATLTLRR
jgi:bacterial/archaeal transporter family-2 protein